MPKIRRNDAAEERRINRGIKADPDAYVPTEAEWAHRTRGPQIAPTKVPVSIRLDRDVLDRLRADGRGWQGRANAMLRRALNLG